MKKILMVEDDDQIIVGLKEILQLNGYEAVAVKGGADALTAVEEGSIELVIMDVNLGRENGFDICKKIREKSAVPVIFLTAYDSELELIRGFRAGGDDYLTKPFRMQELLVRIEALLRRCSRKSSNNIRSGEIVYHTAEYQIEKSGIPLELTAIELKIVVLLLAEWPKTIDREALCHKIWDSHFVDANTINVNISRLREKLGKFNEKGYIETVRGIGYRWGVPVD